MSTPVVRVQEKGQVTIPREIREKLDLKKGDLVTFVETEEGIVIKPAEVVVSDTLDEIGRALKKKGISLEKLMKRGREIRGELIKEEYDIADTQPGIDAS
jgi:AbrB family looped-hinge helix DNA binding protein